MRKAEIRLYILFALGLMLLDRLTKNFVMYVLPHYRLNSCMAIDLVYNRGISFGLFHSQDDVVFSVVNLFVVSVIVMLMMHAYYRFRSQQVIFGEVCIFAGALSNLLDRYLYGGVIDFIALSYRNWHFAIFNGADVFIFCGVLCMIVIEYSGLWEK